ncbi:hypothetical protein AALP_AAs49824U000100 [Arabis alpina]|uniref:Uncharacterized protein n=1 Tax=Arabis alpina TaxID=50452 RepID=A0A087G3M4_ARAAL|nr:hypothetical protein AALP_AAs49824U000100 [Arabis alpina]
MGNLFDSGYSQAYFCSGVGEFQRWSSLVLLKGGFRTCGWAGWRSG